MLPWSVMMQSLAEIWRVTAQQMVTLDQVFSGELPMVHFLEMVAHTQHHWLREPLVVTTSYVLLPMGLD